MKLNHLRDVLAVAELGSLRAAGRHLGVAQPAITRSIREIEQELDVSLFQRHARGVRLTEFGEVFVRRAIAVQAELQRARDELAQIKGRLTGEISISLSTASIIALMPAAFRRFRKSYPDALLKVSEGLFQSVEAELVDGKIDFWVGPLDPTYSSPQLAVERLFEHRRLVVCRKGHAMAAARSLADLAGAQWIRPTITTRLTEGDFDAMFDRLGLPQPSIVMHSKSAFVTLNAVSHSDLLTILPQQWLDLPAAEHMIAAIDVKEELLAAPMCIVRRHGLPLTPMAQSMFEMMVWAAGVYADRYKLSRGNSPSQ